MFCVVIVIGSVMKIESIINLTDAMMLGMAVPNCLAMFFMAKELNREFFENLNDKSDDRVPAGGDSEGRGQNGNDDNKDYQTLPDRGMRMRDSL